MKKNIFDTKNSKVVDEHSLRKKSTSERVDLAAAANEFRRVSSSAVSRASSSNGNSPVKSPNDSGMDSVNLNDESGPGGAAANASGVSEVDSAAAAASGTRIVRGKHFRELFLNSATHLSFPNKFSARLLHQTTAR